MKLIASLFLLVVADFSAGYSDFTNGITSYFPDSTGTINTLDQVYSDVTTNAAALLVNMIESLDLPEDVVNYIEFDQENYNPWYTEIQTNIDTGKATAKQAVLDAYALYSTLPDIIEQKYNQMVEKFSARSCSTYSQYEQAFQYKATSILSQIQAATTDFQTNVQGSIPTSVIYIFNNELQKAMTVEVEGFSMLTLIEMAENSTMSQISDLYSYAAQYTEAYTFEYFNKSFSSTLDRLATLLDDMVYGALIAQCA